MVDLILRGFMKTFLITLCVLMSFSALAADGPNTITVYRDGPSIYCSDANKISLIRASIEDMQKQAAAYSKFVASKTNSNAGFVPWGFNMYITDNNRIEIRIGISGNDDLINEARSERVITRKKIEISIIGSDCVVIN